MRRLQLWIHLEPAGVPGRVWGLLLALDAMEVKSVCDSAHAATIAVNYSVLVCAVAGEHRAGSARCELQLAIHFEP